MKEKIEKAIKRLNKLLPDVEKAAATPENSYFWEDTIKFLEESVKIYLSFKNLMDQLDTENINVAKELLIFKKKDGLSEKILASIAVSFGTSMGSYPEVESPKPKLYIKHLNVEVKEYAEGFMRDLERLNSLV